MKLTIVVEGEPAELRPMLERVGVALKDPGEQPSLDTKPSTTGSEDPGLEQLLASVTPLTFEVLKRIAEHSIASGGAALGSRQLRREMKLETPPQLAGRLASLGAYLKRTPEAKRPYSQEWRGDENFYVMDVGIAQSIVAWNP